MDKLLRQLMDLHPKYIDLSLTRLSKLLIKIGNPHLKIPPVIHIAGTNGKGSTLSYIRYILMQNNYKVSAYISPHLKSFNERVIINNKQIKSDKLFNTLNYIKKINANNPITFFEITTAAAFYLFSKTKDDFLILETGLGGRLDATNIIKQSLIDIITPIGIDHQEFLGKSIYKISDEKIGIVKENSNIVISKQRNNIFAYLSRKLRLTKNNKFFYGKDFKVINNNNKNFSLTFNNKKYIYSKPNLIGEHQIENASTAIATILRLQELGYLFSKKNINIGIKNTKWPGRLEKGRLGNIKVYLDGAHNIDGATILLNYFKSKNLKVWLIIGMLNNKDIKAYLKKLKPIINGVVAISIPNEKNSYTPILITNVCDNLKIKSFECKSIRKANIFLSKKINAKNILISGSLYLIGKVRNIYL